MYGDLLIPRFNMVSQYKIKGRILLLPIHGQGQSNITICKTPHLNICIKVVTKTRIVVYFICSTT
jgi:Haemolymph juvenile hormone binding protein (JHBP)